MSSTKTRFRGSLTAIFAPSIISVLQSMETPRWQKLILAGAVGLFGVASSCSPALGQVAAGTVAESAAQAIDRGDLVGARSVLEPALKQYPRSAALHKIAAVLDFKTGQLDAMRAELQQTVECDPNDSETYLNLALLDLGQRRYAQAIPSLNAYLRLKPRDAEGHMLLGRAYLNRNLTLEAMPEIRKALAIDARLPLAHHDLGLALMTLGNDDEALEEFRQETEVNPTFGGAYLRAGTIDLDYSRLPEAEEFLRQATVRDPGEANGHFQLARCYLQERKPVAAEAEYSKAIALDSKLIRAHYGRAQALQALGRKEEADREFRIHSDLVESNRKSASGIAAAPE